ncbi:MAG: tRNA uridine-5-carboxymethylaminomethyl(34) synthesis GTPase MnmE [Burkholderiales bacterium]
MPGAEPAAAPDTIAAIATPAGRGALGVVRVTGPATPQVARGLLPRLPVARRATLAPVRDARGETLDEAIVLHFPAPHSYTGEDVLEIHAHGGPIVLQSILQACLDAGARLAQPGEFTRRAFLNGRLDLAQAEAVADLIDAASHEAARSALRSLQGEFSSAVRALTAQLTELRALIEAMLDFPEEEIDALHREDVERRLARVRQALADVRARSREGSLLRAGIHVVLAGRPNVGKSSLLNRLAGAERAIVTSIPGTTRDALREAIQIDGVPLVVVDTAGLRSASDEVERLGVERTRAEMSQADLLLVVHDASVEAAGMPEEIPRAISRVDVYNKIDLAPSFRPPTGATCTVLVSAKTGTGIDQLRHSILQAAGWGGHGETVFLARERHLRALADAAICLDAAAQQSSRWEFFAEELRLAQQSLSALTGEFTADDLLGEIFSRFCIGK